MNPVDAQNEDRHRHDPEPNGRDPPTVSSSGGSGGSGKEGDDASIAFTVALDKATSRTVTVDYATSDGSADAGDDYTAKSGTLTFSPGQTSKTISVAIEDDIENESDETFSVTLSNASGADLATSTTTGTIENRRVEPLTARFENMPAEHDSSQFTFDLHFSENVKTGFAKIRDRAFTLDEADIVEASRKNPQASDKNKSWTITVKPDGNDAISITLPETTNCSSNRGICTHDERKLSHSTSASIADPVGITVGDARVQEAAGAVLTFAVALSRTPTSDVSVDYATSDGTAEAGADYTSTSGTLTINSGSRSGSIDVTVLDDSHDDDGETLTLTLSNASNGVLTDATAAGTIENKDALPAALVARFGRTAAVNVVDQVEQRINAPRVPGFDGRVAGGAINRDMGQTFALDFLQQLGGHCGGCALGTPVGVPSAKGAALLGRGVFALFMGLFARGCVSPVLLSGGQQPSQRVPASFRRPAEPRNGAEDRRSVPPQARSLLDIRAAFWYAAVGREAGLRWL